MLQAAVKRGSLVDGDELLLVNASNTGVWLGSGVSAAISRACGAGYQEHIRALLEATYGGDMEPGQVLLTDAGAHPRARWVAHVAVMDYRGAARGTGKAFPTERVIDDGSRNLWRACEAVAAERVSVAMVALGAGTGGLGVRTPTELACRSLLEHVAANPATKIERVVFYGWLLHEHMAIAEVVCRHFPSALESLDVELRRHVEEALRGNA